MTESTNPYAPPSVTGIPGTCTSHSEVDYEFTADDWIRFALRQNYSFQETAIRQRRRLYWGVAIIAAAINVLWIQFGAPWLVALPLLALSLLFVFRATFFLAQYRTRSEQLLRKMITRKSNRGVLGSHRMELTADGIRGRSPGGTFTLAWWAVVDLESTGEYLHFYTSSMSAHTVPARAFATVAHFQAFREHARRLWEPHRRRERA